MMQEETVNYDPQDHPWVEMSDDSVDEEMMVIRYSLDEIRIG